MNEARNQEPNKRLRSILSGQDHESDAQDRISYKSPLLLLPHRKPGALETPSLDRESVALQGPGQPPELAQPHAPGVGAEQAWLSRIKKFGPPFWTVTGILSLIVNGILIAMLLIFNNMRGQLTHLQGTANTVGASVLGGLYSNFENMDRATIKTVIPVDAKIPLNLTVPVQTTTQITLAESVAIPNTYVEINTGSFTLNSAARVTLPAGTPLIVNLNFDLPVQATVPVHLDVPVNIPMAETELHEPFVGLQEVVRPWYCLVDPNAYSLRGQAICQ